MIFVYIVSGILMLLSIIIQGHPSFDVIRIAGVKPDLLFIVAIYLSYSFGSFYGETCAFIGGLFQDAISNSPLGLLALPKVIICFIVGMIGRDRFTSNATVIVVTLLLFIASLLKGLITLFLCYVFREGSISQVISVILPEAFYNALLSPILFMLFDRIFARELNLEGM